MIWHKTLNDSISKLFHEQYHGFTYNIPLTASMLKIMFSSLLLMQLLTCNDL